MWHDLVSAMRADGFIALYLALAIPFALWVAWNLSVLLWEKRHVAARESAVAAAREEGCEDTRTLVDRIRADATARRERQEVPIGFEPHRAFESYITASEVGGSTRLTLVQPSEASGYATARVSLTGGHDDSAA